MLRASFLEPETKKPEIHRNTPFEYALTAEPQHTPVTSGLRVCSVELKFSKPSVLRLASVRTDRINVRR